MKKSKEIQIKINLIDGDVSGRIKCENFNWRVIAYKIPREMVEESQNLDALQRPGIYFLFGNLQIDERPIVYVGQAGLRKNGQGVINRILEHTKNKEKDYFEEAVVITTITDYLGATELNYLENSFCNMAKETNRYEVKNLMEPNFGKASKNTDFEIFIENTSMILGALGYKVFEPVKKKKNKTVKPKKELYATKPKKKKKVEVVCEKNDEVIFYLKQKNKDVSARGIEGKKGKFIVLAGSKISSVVSTFKKDTPERSKNLILEIMKIREENSKYIGKDWITSKDIVLGSPSAAANFVVGRSANGKKEWKTEKGITLKEYRGK